MSDLRKERTTRDWKAHLTPSERKRLTEIDRQLKKLDGLVGLLRAERRKIQNRATVRAEQ